MTEVTEKTGVIVTVYEWSEEKGYTTRNIDVSDIVPGMYVRELGGLLKVIGKTVDDGEDYMIHTDDGYMSPLCIDTEHIKVERSPESEHKIDFISVDKNGNQSEWHMTSSELIDAFNLHYDSMPKFTDTVLSCAFANQYLKFKTVGDLWYTFCWG